MRKIILTVSLIVGFAGITWAKTVEVDGWQIASFNDPASGSFKFCAMAAEFGEADKLTFGITNENILMAVVQRPGWSFKRGTSLKVDLRADNRVLGPSRTDVTGPSEIRVVLQYSGETIETLSASSVLEFVMEPEGVSFDISGATAAFKMLNDCFLAEQAAAMAQASPASPNASGESADRAFVEAMLAESGLQGAGFAYLPPESRNGWYDDAAYSWTDGTVWGAMYQYPKQGGDFDATASGILAQTQSQCGGELKSGEIPTKPLQNGAANKLVVQHCMAAGGISQWVALLDEGETILVVYHGAVRTEAQSLNGPAADMYNLLRNMVGVK